MDKKEFQNSITREELAKTSELSRFLWKTYLDILLKGGKIRERAYLYSMHSITGISAKFLHEGQELKQNIGELLMITDKIARQELMEAFDKMIKEKKWEVTEGTTEYYDQNGKLILEEDIPKKKIISKMIEQTSKTTYFIDDKLDIKELRRGRE